MSKALHSGTLYTMPLNGWISQRTSAAVPLLMMLVWDVRLTVPQAL